MILNFKWFKVELIFTRAYFTPRQIRKHVQEDLWTTKSKLKAIQTHRRLTNFATTLLESKQFVDSLPQPPKPEPDPTKCAKCGGPADNGHDRELPPKPYLCSKCGLEDAWERDPDQ